MIGKNGKSAQHCVAIGGAAQAPVLAGTEFQTELVGDRVYLIVFVQRFIHADDFLERDDVGIDLFQDLRDAHRPHAAVHATTLVNVVRSNAKRKHV